MRDPWRAACTFHPSQSHTLASRDDDRVPARQAKPNPSLLSTVLYLALSEKAAQLQDDRPGARTSMEHILV